MEFTVSTSLAEETKTTKMTASNGRVLIVGADFPAQRIKEFAKALEPHSMVIYQPQEVLLPHPWPKGRVMIGDAVHAHDTATGHGGAVLGWKTAWCSPKKWPPTPTISRDAPAV